MKNKTHVRTYIRIYKSQIAVKIKYKRVETSKKGADMAGLIDDNCLYTSIMF